MAGLLDDTSGFGGLLGNPLFNAGLGILAAAGRPGATFGGAVGQGGLLGMQNLQQAQQAQALNAYRQSQMQEAQRKAELQRQQQSYIANAIQGLPPEQQSFALAAPDEFFKAKAGSMFPKDLGPLVAAPGSQIFDRANPTQPLYSVPTKPERPTDFEQLTAAAGLRPGTPEYQAAARAKLTGREGIVLTQPDGTQIRIGGMPGDPAGLQKPTVAKVEDQIINNSGRLQRLDTIASQFKPEYLQFGPQVKNWAAGMAERAGMDLDSGTQQQLADFTRFRSAAMNDLNTTLKEMSGAAVTPQEADRLLQVIADARSDSPTQFKSKLGEVTRSVKLAQARLFYIRSRGLDPAKFGGVSLDDMPRIIDARGAELVNSGMPKDQALRQIAQEFGMSR